MRRHAPNVDRCPTTGKLCYPHADAVRFARNLRRLTHERVTEYRCRPCGWWHVGHQFHQPRRGLSTRLRSRSDGGRGAREPTTA